MIVPMFLGTAANSGSQNKLQVLCKVAAPRHPPVCTKQELRVCYRLSHTPLTDAIDIVVEPDTVRNLL